MVDRVCSLIIELVTAVVDVPESPKTSQLSGRRPLESMPRFSVGEITEIEADAAGCRVFLPRKYLDRL